MTSDLGGAVLTLSTDMSKLSSGIDAANSKIESLGSTAQNIESKLTFTQLAVSFDAVVQGIERMVGSISSAYGHLTKFTQGLAYVHAENMSIKLIFGEAADAIFEFGQTASTSVGLSAKAFNELVAPLGSLLTNVAGLTKVDAAGWAIELAKRASDLAFVFNVDVNQAMTAVGAAVRGEVEPIRALGVSFNAVMVEAKAMAMTGKENAEALTEQDKAMARLMLVMDQTSELSGVFAGNTDLLFQKQQKLTAEIQNLSGELGAKLIPLNIKLIDLFTALPEGVQLAAYALQTFGGDVINLAAGLGQATIGIAGLITAIPAIARAIQAAAIAMGTFNLALTAIVVVIGAAVLAYRMLTDSSDDSATATQRQADAQTILETTTVAGIKSRRDLIAGLLEEAKAADTTASSVNNLGVVDIEAAKAQEAHKLVIADLEGKLYTYDSALGMVTASEEKTKLSTDGVTSAAEQMIGTVDKGTTAITSWDMALTATNATLDGMTQKAEAAFGAIDKFKNVPTQEQLDLDAAIAGVNLRLADAKVRLDEATVANDGNAAAIEAEIVTLEGEKEVLGHVEDRLNAARDATVAMTEAKVGASGAVQGLTRSEQELLIAAQDAGYAMSGQLTSAQNLAAAMYAVAAAAGTAAGALESLQQLAANPIQVPIISPGPYSAPGQAGGTDNWRGGVTWLGEKGPELVNLPKGSQVFSHAQSMSLMGRAGHLASGTMGGGGGGGFGWVPQLTNDLKDAGAEATKAAATLQKLREMWAAYVRDVGVNAGSYDDYMSNMLESTNLLASGMQGLIAEDFSLVRDGFYDLTDTVAVAGQEITASSSATVDSLLAMWDSYVRSFSYTPEQLEGYYRNMQESLQKLGDGFQGIIAEDFSIVPMQFYEVGKGAADGFADGIAPLTPFLDSVAEAVAIWGNGIVSEMTDTFKQALAISAQIAAAGASGSAVPVLGTATAKATSSSGSAAPPANVIKPVAGNSVAQEVARLQAIADASNAMNAGIPTYAHGTPFVPMNMVARVHRGERIISANENRKGGEQSVINVQVFVGDREITDIVDVRITENNSRQRRAAQLHGYLN